MSKLYIFLWLILLSLIVSSCAARMEKPIEIVFCEGQTMNFVAEYDDAGNILWKIEPSDTEGTIEMRGKSRPKKSAKDTWKRYPWAFPGLQLNNMTKWR